VGYSVTGVDPTIMGIGPADAIKILMQKEKMDLKDVDLVEVCLTSLLNGLSFCLSVCLFVI